MISSWIQPLLANLLTMVEIMITKVIQMAVTVMTLCLLLLIRLHQILFFLHLPLHPSQCYHKWDPQYHRCHHLQLLLPYHHHPLPQLALYCYWRQMVLPCWMLGILSLCCHPPLSSLNLFYHLLCQLLDSLDPFLHHCCHCPISHHH
ncbi:hypothetical protein L208DRAFT_255497 [Tricholoma matsutake]|nr:hypothetical protein L208DRAFT_255497 [Tricholoma matsutake 945]